MNKAKSIIIKGDPNADILSVRLNDVLQQVSNGQLLTWAILFIRATGNLEVTSSVIDFEDKVNESSNGMVIPWDQLNSLVTKFNQIIDLTIIGSRNPKDIVRYQNDNIMHLTCEYTIELIDSSYWVIHCQDVNNLRNFKDAFPGSELEYEEL